MARNACQVSDFFLCLNHFVGSFVARVLLVRFVPTPHLAGSGSALCSVEPNEKEQEIHVQLDASYLAAAMGIDAADSALGLLAESKRGSALGTTPKKGPFTTRAKLLKAEPGTFTPIVLHLVKRPLEIAGAQTPRVVTARLSAFALRTDPDPSIQAAFLATNVSELSMLAWPANHRESVQRGLSGEPLSPVSPSPASADGHSPKASSPTAAAVAAEPASPKSQTAKVLLQIASRARVERQVVAWAGSLHEIQVHPLVAE